MNAIVKFMAKYADEALAVATGLNTLMEGLALSPKQSDAVREVIRKLQEAHMNISTSLKDVDKITTVKISRTDIEKAVAAELPKLLEDAITKAVVEALAAEKAKDATDAKSEA